MLDFSALPYWFSYLRVGTDSPLSGVCNPISHPSLFPGASLLRLLDSRFFPKKISPARGREIYNIQREIYMSFGMQQ